MIILVWLHLLGDFVLQSDKMALNKSRSNYWLAVHCMVYSIPMLWFGVTFAIFAGVSHFIVDFISSRMTKVLWAKEERHWFFVTIGVDQAIHLSLLILAMEYLI